jgi:hypothetical protein
VYIDGDKITRSLPFCNELPEQATGKDVFRVADECLHKWTAMERLYCGPADFPPRLPGFDPRSSHVGFIVDKLALGQVSSEYCSLPCQFSYHRLLRTYHHLSSGTDTIGQVETDVPSGLSLRPPQEIKKYEKNGCLSVRTDAALSKKVVMSGFVLEVNPEIRITANRCWQNFARCPQEFFLNDPGPSFSLLFCINDQVRAFLTLQEQLHTGLSVIYFHDLHGLGHAWSIRPLEEYVGSSVRYFRSVK